MRKKNATARLDRTVTAAPVPILYIVPPHIGAEVSYAQAPLRRSTRARNALEIAHTDHAVCDVIIVDREQRQPMGRPVLTLAMDAQTRAILGILLSLEAPRWLSVGLCLQHAVLLACAIWLSR